MALAVVAVVGGKAVAEEEVRVEQMTSLPNMVPHKPFSIQKQNP